MWKDWTSSVTHPHVSKRLPLLRGHADSEAGDIVLCTQCSSCLLSLQCVATWQNTERPQWFVAVHAQAFTEESMAFQTKMVANGGLGQETYLPDGVMPCTPYRHSTLSTAAHHTRDLQCSSHVPYVCTVSYNTVHFSAPLTCFAAELESLCCWHRRRFCPSKDLHGKGAHRGGDGAV